MVENSSMIEILGSSQWNNALVVDVMTVEPGKQSNSDTLDANTPKKERNKISSTKNNEIKKTNTNKKVRNEKNGFVSNNWKNGEINPLIKEKLENGENNAALKGKHSQESETVDNDYFDILEGLEEEEDKRLRIEDYMNSLPELLEARHLDFDESQSRERLSDKLLEQRSSSGTRKTSPINPYIINNVTLFSQKKNYSFNSYQLWKIKRDNEKIAERLISLEKRKMSGDYINSLKRIPSSAAVFRERNFRKIEAENKAMEQEIQRIKERPNRKAPWYKTGSPWHITNSEKNKKT